MKDKQENILQILANLADEFTRGSIIIVEGKKDVAALRDLNIIGPIITAKTGGKTPLEILQELRNGNPTEIILLFDFDDEGEKLTSLYKQELERSRIKINLVYRRHLSSLLGRELRCIEGLPSYLKTLERKIV